MVVKLSSTDRGVVIGGPEYDKSCASSLIDSEMVGPISMKLSGIDQGNSVTIMLPIGRGFYRELERTRELHTF